MTVPAAGATRIVELGDGLTLTVAERGDAGATAVLLLHGGGGPRSVAGFAAALAEDNYVLAPVHPGFDGAPRPAWFDSVGDLAVAYLDLLDRLDLREVVVIGSSVGGWIAAEMALRDTQGRMAGLVLIDAVGIRASDPREIADPATLGPVEFGKLTFCNQAFRVAPATLTDDQRAVTDANLRTLAVYAGDPYMHDPKLRRRLHRIGMPVLVIWGEQDGVASIEYGLVYAESFPHARFEPISEAGHLPHLEQPAATLKAVNQFVAEVVPRA